MALLCPQERLPERQLAYLEQRRAHLDTQAEHTMPWYRVVVALFTTPVGYKPLLILVCVFLAQNFSGVYISLFYAAPLFQVGPLGHAAMRHLTSSPVRALDYCSRSLRRKWG